MKNFNRRDSHGHHGSKRRELSQHAHSRGSHAFTRTLTINTVTTTRCKAPAQLLFFNACWVCSCFRNARNSDMDYRIFNVRMLFRMRAYTNGSWAHRQRVSTTSLTRGKTQSLSACVPDGRDSNPRPVDLQSNALTTEPTRHP